MRNKKHDQNKTPISYRDTAVGSLYALPGLIAYGPVQIFLSILTFAKLQNKMPASTNDHPGKALCHFDQDHMTKTLGWLIGSLAVISNVAFTGRMLYQLRRKKRSTLNQLTIGAQCLTLAAIAGTMNGDNAYEASRYFLLPCNQEGSNTLTDVASDTITTIAVLFSALSKSIAMTDEIKPTLLLTQTLLRKHLLPQHHNRRQELEVICHQTPLDKIDKITAEQSLSLGKALAQYVSLIGCGYLSYAFICLSYDEFGSRPVQQLLQALNSSETLNLDRATQETLSAGSGTLSWHYNSVLNAILLSNTLFPPRQPDCLGSSLGSIAIVVGLLAALNSAPLLVIPFLQNTLEPTNQLITACAMVISNMAFAWIGLGNTLIERKPGYQSRKERTQEQVDKIQAAAQLLPTSRV